MTTSPTIPAVDLHQLKAFRLLQYAIGAEFECVGDRLHTLCPVHEADGNLHGASLHLWDEDRGGRWRCSPCAEGGDLVDYLQFRDGLAFGAAVTEAQRLLAEMPADWVGQQIDSRPEPRPDEFVGRLAERVAHLDADPEAQRVWAAWAATRGLDLNVLRTDWRVGGDDKILTVPHFSRGDVLTGLRFRPTEGKKWSERSSRFGNLYGIWRDQGREQVVLVEGESDAWAAQRLWPDSDVLGLPAGIDGPREHWLDQLLGEGRTRVIVAVDWDAASEPRASEWVAAIRARGVQAVRLRANIGKDLGDVVAGGGGLEDLVDPEQQASFNIVVGVNGADGKRLPGKHIVATFTGANESPSVVEVLDPAARDSSFWFAVPGADYAESRWEHLRKTFGATVRRHTPRSALGAVGRKITVTFANTIKPAPVIWAWEDENGEGRIPAGTLSVAAGREGTGKSSFSIWLIARITTGTLPGSFYGTPRLVLVATVEDSWKHTIVPRLMAAGADLSKVARVDVSETENEDLTMSLPDDLQAVEDVLIENHAAMLVLDPLMSMLGEELSANQSREVRKALDPLAKIADRTGAIVLSIAHFNKSSGTDASSLITGSGAFKDVPRTVFAFARDEDTRVMTQTKNSLGRDDLASLEYTMTGTQVELPDDESTEVAVFAFDGESDRSVSDMLREAHGGATKETAQTWLVGYLEARGGFADVGEVTRAGMDAGHKQATLKQARIRAKITSDKVDMLHWRWTLPSAKDDS